jgi:isoleucyl-tRNA synthetase
VHAIQGTRKAAGLAVEDRIRLILGGDRDLLEAVREHEPYVANETLATAVVYDGAGEEASTLIEGRKLRIGVEPV